ncbi:MAG: hypothetical protein QF371_03965, partial [Flavobacteriales bacterium]|nr:hypothetical protein [Flavobacteriales bacterium]
MDTTQYFYRNIIFSKQGQTISIVDIFNPEEKGEVLEPWFGIVVQMADGQHTIDELFDYLATRYNGTPPPNLKETITSVVERLVESKFIVLTKEATELPYYLSVPAERLDLEKAK